MASTRNGGTITEPRETTRPLDDTDDILALTRGPTGAAPAPTETEYAVGEVLGDTTVEVVEPVATESDVVMHDEVVSPLRAESDEEFLEATAAQLLAAESGAETAISDLEGIEGFERGESGAESMGPGIATPLPDAGSALDGQQAEFLPALSAIIPALASTVAPSLAKAVVNRLSPRTRRIMRRLPVRRVASAAVRGATRGSTGSIAGTVANTALGLVSKLFESAEQAPTGTEADVQLDEALVQETVQVLEVIIGSDDRVRIPQTTGIPWRRICALRITFPSGAIFRGTGFLIGPRAVATAGHCVFLRNQGGWAHKVEVIPAANGSSRPFGQAEARSFRSVTGWVNSSRPESDYGCIVLPPNAFGGRNLGTFGFAAFDAAALLAQAAVVAGYPGDKPFAELWGMSRKLKTVAARTLIYDIDTMGGQSGAPVYIKRNGQRYVVGIHNYGASSGNSATRITLPVYQRLRAWSKL